MEAAFALVVYVDPHFVALYQLRNLRLWSFQRSTGSSFFEGGKMQPQPILKIEKRFSLFRKSGRRTMMSASMYIR